ncbi:MAG: bifunctional riboflavin kinase/FAD synthetase [Chloroflexi bacterium]|nr:bifunctional riboflavin kinase/FAD synthetase [Chloroflexota bacterium]
MSFRQRLASAAPSKETVVTVGVFDGVHQGHRHLLRQVVRLAGGRYIPTVVTFSNRPITVLRPGTEPSYLTTPEQRIDLIKQQGIELVVCLEFTLELAQVTAADFAKILIESLKMKGLILGPDSALGKDRQGDLAFMQRQGEKLGFWAQSVEPLEIKGQPVKSRRIRDALADGDVSVGPELLGRNHYLSGVVVVGDRRGRSLGFPTANIEVDPQLLLPGDGIYATWAIIDGQRHQSATSIGVRPTFGLTQRLVEVFIMDFDADLYGKTVGVEFVKKVRDQEKFDGLDALVKQINVDVDDCRKVLTQDRSHSPEPLP